jgi:hypothetical protein
MIENEDDLNELFDIKSTNRKQQNTHKSGFGASLTEN